MINIAHRGARSVAPENTLASAEKAYGAGADLWEFDVRHTRDRYPVVIHDRSLVRTTNVREVYPGRDSYGADDFTLAEIKRLDAGSWFGVKDPFGEVKKGCVSSSEVEYYRGQKVPSLSEALELTRDYNWRASIEIKTVGNKLKSEITGSVVSLVEEMNMESEVLISSFAPSVVKTITELNQRIATGILLEDPVDNPVSLLKEMGGKSYNISYSGFNTEMGKANIESLRRSGGNFKVIVWTVNETSRLKELTANPFVDGIVTDYPQRLSELLASK